MEISVYLNGPRDAIQKMEREIETWSDYTVSVLQSPPQLVRQLQLPAQRPSIVVLMVSDRQELAELHKFHAFMQNIAIILILPSHEPALFALAFNLYPRFVTVIDNDFKEITAVIRKIMARCRVLDKRSNTLKSDSQGGFTHG